MRTDDGTVLSTATKTKANFGKFGLSQSLSVLIRSFSGYFSVPEMAVDLFIFFPKLYCCTDEALLLDWIHRTW